MGAMGGLVVGAMVGAAKEGVVVGCMTQKFRIYRSHDILVVDDAWRMVVNMRLRVNGQCSVHKNVQKFKIVRYQILLAF